MLGADPLRGQPIPPHGVVCSRCRWESRSRSITTSDIVCHVLGATSNRPTTRALCAASAKAEPSDSP